MAPLNLFFALNLFLATVLGLKAFIAPILPMAPLNLFFALKGFFSVFGSADFFFKLKPLTRLPTLLPAFWNLPIALKGLLGFTMSAIGGTIGATGSFELSFLFLFIMFCFLSSFL